MRVMHRVLVLVALAACGRPVGGASPGNDPCALPGGVDLATLDPKVSNLLLRRSLVCSDHANGRIGDEEYRERVSVLDAELAKLDRKTVRVRPDGVDADVSFVDWASSVIDVSTQYTDSAWSANQVLGPPNVFPAYGDNDKAWASLGADDRDEYIEVGFASAGSISAVEVVETYNPGAVDEIQLITVGGRRIDVPLATTPPAPAGQSRRRVYPMRCTREKIAAVRIHLDSVKVAGWNEIDAIGVHPCTP
jgi:hypothetical protein